MNCRRMLVPALLWLTLACGCSATGNTQSPDSVLAAFASSSSEPALQAVGFPRFSGRADAPHTVILYTNPQCPPCRASWKTFPALLQGLDPARSKVIVTGYGFSDEGTRLMFVAAVLAEQQPDMAVAFVSAVMAAGVAPYVRGWDWVEDWLRSALFAENWDAARFRQLVGSKEAAVAYVEGVERIRRAYGLHFTPALLVDGRLYEGPHTAHAVRAAMEPVSPPTP